MILLVSVMLLSMVSGVPVLASLMSELVLIVPVDVRMIAALMMMFTTLMVTAVMVVALAVIGRRGHSESDESEKDDKLWSEI